MVCVNYSYDFPLSNLINGYKHRRNLLLERPLIHLWLRALAGAPMPRPDGLVPVPTHWRRHWLRGFNQAERLARGLSGPTGIPVMPILRRVRPTTPQQGQNRRQRQQGLADAFQVTAGVKGRHLALVDDVMTTGATARAATRALRRAGARRVDVWVLARTPERALPR